MLLLDAPTSAEKRRARCDPGLDVLERGEEDGLEGGTSETTGGAIWVRGLDVRVARENVTEPAQEGGRVKFSQGIGDLIARLDVDHADGLTENELAKNVVARVDEGSPWAGVNQDALLPAPRGLRREALAVPQRGTLRNFWRSCSAGGGSWGL